jgi:hypothetical protein
MHAGLAATVLLGAPALADDAEQTATRTMREAMAEQVGTPAVHHAPSDSASPSAVQPMTHVKQQAKPAAAGHHGRAAQADAIAHRHASMDGSSQAGGMRAAVANRAAMGAMGPSMAMAGASEAGSDCHSAVQTMRSAGPGAGMMGGSTTGSTTVGTGTMPGSGTPTTTSGAISPMGRH